MHKTADSRAATAIAIFQEMCCDTGMPSRVIRLSTEQNNHRLLELIGNIPPAEAEARYYAAQQEIALVA
jgi:hypothetical protein